MDKTEKLEFQKRLETQFEDQQVQELFNQWIKELMILRPENPIDYLITRVRSNVPLRIIILGPPTKFVSNISAAVARKFTLEHVITGELIKHNVEIGTDIGKRMASQFKSNELVDDELVVKLVLDKLRAIDTLSSNEKPAGSKQGYILNGFPRTRYQALMLQKAGVIPDKTFFINMNKENIIQAKINTLKLLQPENTDINEFYQHIQDKYQEYLVHNQQVLDSYKGFVNTIDANDMDVDSSVNKINIIINSKPRGRIVPLRPLRVIIVGPPGSGNSTQSKIISEKLGLIHVNVKSLVQYNATNESPFREQAVSALKEGKLLDEDTMLQMVINRLQESDCVINGWVLDGFPQHKSQVSGLSERNLNPSHVFVLELNDMNIQDRIERIKFDPVTGEQYNTKALPSQESIVKRLVAPSEQKTEIISSRLEEFRSVYESAFLELDNKNFHKIDATNGEKVISEQIMGIIGGEM